MTTPEIDYRYKCTDAYEELADSDGWLQCPNCGLKPRVWVFGNGRSTACGCGEDQYDHFSIHAESVVSVHMRTDGKKMTEYKGDGLRLNWNHWCRTGEELFVHASRRNDGRW